MATTKKKTEKKAPAKKTAAKKPQLKVVEKPPIVEDQTIDQAIDAIVEYISESHYASSEVTRNESVEFYESIASRCQENADTIKSEMRGDED